MINPFAKNPRVSVEEAEDMVGVAESQLLIDVLEGNPVEIAPPVVKRGTFFNLVIDGIFGGVVADLPPAPVLVKHRVSKRKARRERGRRKEMARA